MDPPSKSPTDSVVRVITEDSAFRVIAAVTSETVRGAAAAQNATGDVAKRFRELLTGTILIREAMAPGLRVQGILKEAGGRSTLVADSWPNGTARGLVAAASMAPQVASGARPMLTMMRTLPRGRIQQGVVEIPEGGGISDALMRYLQESEQIVSTLAVETALDESGRPAASAGYLVQLLPEVDRGALLIMTERLHDLPGPTAMLGGPNGDVRKLLDELLHGMPYTQLEESALRFECGCNQIAVMTTLATLDRGDIEQMVEDGKPLEIRCDYCGKDYAVETSRLHALLVRS